MTTPLLYQTPLALVHQLKYVDQNFFSSPELSNEDLIFIQKIISMSEDELNEKEMRNDLTTRRIFQILHNYTPPPKGLLEKIQQVLIRVFYPLFFTRASKKLLAKIQQIVMRLFHSLLYKPDTKAMLANNIYETLQNNPHLPSEITNRIVAITGHPSLFEHLKGKGDDVERRQHTHWKQVAIQIGLEVPKGEKQVQKLVKEHMTDLISIISSIKNSPPEIKPLLQKPITVENFIKLKEWKAAWDTVKILQVLQKDHRFITDYPDPSLEYEKTLQLLRELPNILDQNKDRLAEITSLRINNIPLTTLPRFLGKLLNLERLELEKTALEELPSFIEAFKELKELRIDSFNSDRGLKKIPPNIGNLPQLKTLILRHNRLATLPESIGKLSQLLHLELQGNQLTTLPTSIGKLLALEGLNLGGNQLTTLPESIGNLSRLRWLNLTGNQLTTLPESIGNLSQLLHLALQGNQLTTLPESIGKLSQLTSLGLSENQLTTMPGSIGNLSRLDQLFLGQNQLTTLPESIGELLALKYLKLGQNQLTTLPGSIGKLSVDLELSVEGNPGIKIPESFKGRVFRNRSRGWA